MKKKILKSHVKDCFKINGRHIIKMPKKAEYVRLKKYDRKIKSPLMIYAELESTLVLEDHGRQDRNESYISKCQKHIACKLGWVCDKFSKLFKPYLGEDTIHSFY